MEDLLHLGGIAVCAIVLMAVICRIDQMKKSITSLAWLITYVLFAVYAMGVLLDLLYGRGVDWYESAGVGGLLLYMTLTRRLWREGQDPETVRSELRHADGREVAKEGGAP